MGRWNRPGEVVGAELKRDPPISMRIESAAANLAEVRPVVAKAAADVGFLPEEIDGIVLAIDEALANSIKHGYEARAGQPIDVSLAAIQRDGVPGIEITVRDYGRQVDPRTIRGRNLEDVRPGGLGVHIIETIMDEMEYTCPQDGGMQLRVRKYLKRNSDQAVTSGEA